jgi:hypothetical protein
LYVQHGFLPQLLRRCVAALHEESLPADRPFELVNAVFTLVQLLCHYPAGVDALLASGSVSVLMPLIQRPACVKKFSNRAARILDMVLQSSTQAQQACVASPMHNVPSIRVVCEGCEWEGGVWE